MKVLIVGSGGREHALAWKIARSPELTQLLCAPGNPGTEQLGTNIALDAGNIQEVVSAAAEHAVDLVVVGPEQPLADGLADALSERGIAVFGPGAGAAKLEASKVFAKEFMRRHDIPTADFAVFDDLEAARAHVRDRGAPVVIKADGLAAGKGVTVASTLEQAEGALDEMMQARRFGSAGARVLVEDCLSGREVSLIAISNGQTVVPLAPARDHKRLSDGDAGPNTGGMGAYSPPPDVSPELEARIVERILEPTVNGIRDEGHELRGALYAGVMVVDSEPFVLEFNVRFGDPETQPLMMRLSGDLLPPMLAAARGETVEPASLAAVPQAACCIVMASGGYPGSYEKGHPIMGLAEANALNDVVVFHAGTRREGDNIVTAGGRVLGVTALGDDVRSAAERAYEGVARIDWKDVHYRKDIGRS